MKYLFLMLLVASGEFFAADATTTHSFTATTTQSNQTKPKPTHKKPIKLTEKQKIELKKLRELKKLIEDLSNFQLSQEHSGGYGVASHLARMQTYLPTILGQINADIEYILTHKNS